MQQQGLTYILHKRVARGGMAEIYLGKMLLPNGQERLCAFKKILPHNAQDIEYIEMFRAEATISKRLTHENIVQVYDFARLEDTYALIMEFVAGSDLRSLLAALEQSQVRISIPVALFIAMQTARGLHYAHTRINENSGRPLAIVHRDISPQNILVSFSGQVKVIDFGIAKIEERQRQETKPGIVKGKYSYMSPEQVGAKPLDARTDIFSLGIVLWECLAMRRLFAADTEVETIQNVQQCRITRSLKSLNPDVDSYLEEVVMKALAADPAKRYPSAALFERDLTLYYQNRYPNMHPQAALSSFITKLFSEKKSSTMQLVQELMALKVDPVEAQEQPLPAAAGFASESHFPSGRSDATMGEKPKVIYTQTNLSPMGPPKTLTMIHSQATHPAKKEVSQHTQNQDPSPSQSPVYRNILPGSGFRGPHGSHSQIEWMHARSQHGRSMRSLHPKVQANNNQGLAMIAVSIMAAILFILGVLHYSGQQSTFRVRLTTLPKRAIIQVNNQYLNTRDELGSIPFYLSTPRQLRLPAGDYRVVIRHEGYEPLLFTFRGKSGDAIQPEIVRLISKAPSQMARVRIQTQQSEVLHYLLNYGYVQGKTGSSGVSLSRGEDHHLLIYPSFPDTSLPIYCSFRIPETGKTDYAINITLEPRRAQAICVVE